MKNIWAKLCSTQKYIMNLLVSEEDYLGIAAVALDLYMSYI
jgi:hypothetical protein